MSQEGCELGDAAELLIATFAEAARELGATQRQAHRLQRRLRHKAVGLGAAPPTGSRADTGSRAGRIGYSDNNSRLSGAHKRILGAMLQEVERHCYGNERVDRKDIRV